MESKIKENSGIYLYGILCVLAAAVTLFPIKNNFIMNGGIVTEWIARLEELASGLRMGQVSLFPGAETIVNTGITENGMDSNFWFIIPGMLYVLTGNITFVYRVYLFVVQAGTLLSSMLLFQRIFHDGETKLPVFFASLLYMTCPYRIYVCYDLADLSQAAAWMLLPLYIWAVSGTLAGGKRFRDMAAAVFVLAGIGYADTVFFVIIAGITLLTGLILRKFFMIIPAAAGSVLFLPGLYRLARYLLLDHFAELGLPLHSIMQKGYRLGEYFNSYSFRAGHPGMGLGMILCLLTCLWLGLGQAGRNQQKRQKVCGFFTVLALFFMLLSFYRFPWDLFQRLGIWSLKLVSLIDTPAVFSGMAFLCFCVPAAHSMERISRHENKIIALTVPAAVMIACMGICIYQCNALIYNRPAMVIQP